MRYNTDHTFHLDLQFVPQFKWIEVRYITMCYKTFIFSHHSVGKTFGSNRWPMRKGWCVEESLEVFRSRSTIWRITTSFHQVICSSGKTGRSARRLESKRHLKGRFIWSPSCLMISFRWLPSWHSCLLSNRLKRFQSMELVACGAWWIIGRLWGMVDW